MRRYTVVIDDQRFTLDVEETASDRFEVTVGDRTFEARLEADEDLPGAPISPAMTDAGDAHAAVPFATTGAAPIGPSSGAGPASGASTSSGAGTPSAAAAGPGPRRSSAPIAPAAAASGPVSGSSDTILAPMPGVILAIEVKVGDAVRRGDPVLVLEAMKLRNTIRATRPGVVAAILVEAGQPVAPGTPMVRLGAAPG